MEKKLRIGVLMGGLSIEREVSFNSGRTICDHLDTKLYEIIPLFQTLKNELFILPWKFLHRGKISDFENKLYKEAQQIYFDDLKNYIDFIYIAQHGRYAEDGSLQGFLELLNIPYLGSKILGSALGMNKIFQKDFLRSAKVPVARDFVVLPHQLTIYQKNSTDLFKELHNRRLFFPLIVKPSQEGSSLGVSLVKKQEDLLHALITASTITPDKKQPILIEEYINGMEFTCTLLIHPETEEITFLPPTEIVHTHKADIHDYQQKYMPGYSQKYTPARCTEQEIKIIQETCLKTAQALSINTVARIDGFLKNDGSVVIIDPNTLCGMAPSSFFFNQAACIGMGHSALINHLIQMELEGYGMNIIKKSEILEIKPSKKIRIAVLLGGPSNEKETSLDSGRNVCYKLSPEKYDVLPLFMDKKKQLYQISQQLLVKNSTTEIEQELTHLKKLSWDSLPGICDFVFIALHGAPGENGEVQGALAMLKLPYNGSGILTSSLCMDKYKTNKFLKAHGFLVPNSLLIRLNEWKKNHKKSLGSIIEHFVFPLIVKPHDDGCSVMVQKVKNIAELSQAIDNILLHKKFVLIEECIQGMELTVGVIGNDDPQVLPPSQTLSVGDILSIEEKFLPGAGENQTPAPLPPKTITFVQETIKRAFSVLHCSGYARIDCFYQSAEISKTGKEQVIILEVNNLPGLTPATCLFHQAAEAGIKPMDFIDLIVSLGFEKHKNH